jgi:hypothetical protein
VAAEQIRRLEAKVRAPTEVVAAESAAAAVLADRTARTSVAYRFGCRDSTYPFKQIKGRFRFLRYVPRP